MFLWGFFVYLNTATGVLIGAVSMVKSVNQIAATPFRPEKGRVWFDVTSNLHKKMKYKVLNKVYLQNFFRMGITF